MIRWAPLVGLFCIYTSEAWGCGNLIEEERLQFASRAFVGTVTGYWLDNTLLATELPECPNGGNREVASALCSEFWSKMVSVQFEVEIAIKGIGEHRKYEVETDNRDGCAPRVGEMWLTSGWYLDGFSMMLKGRPAQHQLERWRSISMIEPHN